MCVYVCMCVCVCVCMCVCVGVCTDVCVGVRNQDIFRIASSCPAKQPASSVSALSSLPLFKKLQLHLQKALLMFMVLVNPLTA